MINFATLQALDIPEGKVVEIKDASGRVIWAVSGGKIVLEVAKQTLTTYAGETSYADEQFILLDIYPKTNGTVSVTYGGLTKTITDTSGAEAPNAQQVFFGTFNGVSDSVATPTSGELTIEGDCVAFGTSSFQTGSKNYNIGYCACITAVKKFGNAEKIPNEAFTRCVKISSITIPKQIKDIGINPFSYISKPNFVTVDSGNTAYKIDGNCLIEIATKTVISGFTDSTIPSYIEVLGDYAFVTNSDITNLTLPATLTTIKGVALNGCSGITNMTVLATTPPTVVSGAMSGMSALTKITVPTGCSAAYKAAYGWMDYADYIVEAS